MSENNQNNAQNAQQPVFQIVRIYSKDVSLETPNSPAVFQAAWKPELKVEFDSLRLSLILRLQRSPMISMKYVCALP